MFWTIIASLMFPIVLVFALITAGLITWGVSRMMQIGKENDLVYTGHLSERQTTEGES